MHPFDTIGATPYFMKYGENTWAALRRYLDEVTRVAAAPVIEKYTGLLAATERWRPYRSLAASYLFAREFAERR
jgi:3-methyladenine DNA glycosylase/8-oxoguanine DNA glycosylase